MASLVLKMSVSLDGYVAPRDGSADWEAAGRSPDGAGWVLETVSNASVHLMGAATYASWAGSWPSAPGPFAKPMNDIPKVVFSNSLRSADWSETTIVSGDLTEAVTRLERSTPAGTCSLRAVYGSRGRWSRPASVPGTGAGAFSLSFVVGTTSKGRIAEVSHRPGDRR